MACDRMEASSCSEDFAAASIGLSIFWTAAINPAISDSICAAALVGPDTSISTFLNRLATALGSSLSLITPVAVSNALESPRVIDANASESPTDTRKSSHEVFNRPSSACMECEAFSAASSYLFCKASRKVKNWSRVVFPSWNILSSSLPVTPMDVANNPIAPGRTSPICWRISSAIGRPLDMT